jgi:glycerate 2-kinase
MKIIIAPDSFKESLSAKQAGEIIAKAIKKIIPKAQTVLFPMADGGEGTVESLVEATNGKLVETSAHDPLMRKRDTFYGILGDKKTAVVEMAAASGLHLLSENQRNPLKTTTYGTGELIKNALNKGCRKFIIGLGGSATCDAGAGMAQALGVSFLDAEGNELKPGGENLRQLNKIDRTKLDQRIKECEIQVACDVTNPLYGKNGAAYVYAPQKGADENAVKQLDKNLRIIAEKIKQYLNKDIANIQGAGAAGGLGAGLMAFLNAELKPGFELIKENTQLETEIKNANWVITGEGKIDDQTQYGKTPFGIAKTAKQFNVPVIALAGGLEKISENYYKQGFTAFFSIVNQAMDVSQAIENSENLLSQTTENIARLIKAGC